MSLIVPSGSINTSALVVDDFYLVIVPPGNVILNGVPTNIGGIVGTGSWGQPNSAIRVGGTTDAINKLGPILNNKHNLSSAVLLAATAGGSNSQIGFVCVRVTDGSDSKASVSILDGSLGVLATLTAKYTGTLGNNIIGTIVTGSKKDSLQLQLQITGTSNPIEIYDNLRTGNVADFKTDLVNAINNGFGVQPPSQYVTIATGNGTGTLPNSGTTYNFSGGGDGSLAGGIGTLTSAPTAGGTGYTVGDILTVAGGTGGTIKVSTVSSGVVTAVTKVNAGSGYSILTGIATTGGTGVGCTVAISAITTGVVDADLIGSATTPTGMYVLEGSGASQFCLFGLVDATKFTAIVNFGLTRGMIGVVSFPTGTSSDACIASKNSNGIDSYAIMLLKDFVVWDDGIGNRRSTTADALCVGLFCALAPEQGDGNKPLFGLVGTERSVANAPYLGSEVQLLEGAGINFITNPIPYGNVFGLRHSQNSSSDATINGVNYTRMTNFLAATFAAQLGKYVGQLQSTDPNDQTRANARATISTFLELLKRKPAAGGSGQIDGYSVQLDSSNNPNSAIGRGLMQAIVLVRYLAVIRFFLVYLQGGQTVVLVSNNNPSGSTSSVSI